MADRAQIFGNTQNKLVLMKKLEKEGEANKFIEPLTIHSVPLGYIKL
jgi:hypothetical protein